MIVADRVDEVPAGAGRGLPIPWWGKVGAKLVLGRLPIAYDTWRRLGIFRHGRADVNPAQAVETMRRGWNHYRLLRAATPQTSLELGPGDTVAGALAAASEGGSAVLVDVGDFATHDMSVYRAVASRLAGAEQFNFSSRAELLASCGGAYLTSGLASLKTLPANSLDLVVSTSVLEHVRVAEFDETMRELFRVARPGGLASHMIDFMDHLGGGLNSLRFSSTLWERPDFAALGFYTNRLRLSEIVQRAQAAGFRARVEWAAVWRAPPLARERMAAEFRGLSAPDLTVALADLLLEKP